MGSDHRGVWDGVRWDVWACECGLRIATAGPRHHWNHVLSPAAAARLGVAPPA